MVTGARPRFLTPHEYLEQERAAEFKSEYFAGVVSPMPGENAAHNLIRLGVAANLWAQFKGRPCSVFISDMRVFVKETGLYGYPDVTALGEEAQFADGHKDNLLNPSLLFEVLSPSTEAYDRGKKFNHYQQIATLTDYVLVTQDRICVERYQRQPDGSWRYTSHEDAEEVIHFAELECELRLADIYDKVVFPASLKVDAQPEASQPV